MACLRVSPQGAFGALLAALMLTACPNDPQRPTPLAVSPRVVSGSAATTITIRGQYFTPLIKANYDDPSSARVVTTFAARVQLGDATETRELEAVRFVSTTELEARVPAGLSRGSYTLVVVDPRNNTGTLGDALVVGPAPSDGGPDAASDLAGDGPSDALSSDTLAPDTLAPDTLAPDTLAPDILAPDILAPDILAPDILAPDILAPDILAPDTGPPTYVDEDFSSGAGVVSPQSGSWSVNSGRLRQTDLGGNGLYALAPVTANDYEAETTVTIQQIDGVSAAEGAALGVRVQAPTTANPPRMYFCMVSPDNNRFYVGRCSGNQAYCSIIDSSSLQIHLHTSYRIRARVVGSSLTCSLPDHGRTLNANNLSWSSGDVSLITFHARAAFHYLRVTAP